MTESDDVDYIRQTREIPGRLFITLTVQPRHISTTFFLLHRALPGRNV